MKRFLIGCSLSCMLLTHVASAAVTYDVTGTVNEVANDFGVTAPIGVGSTLTGQFTLEVLTPRSGGGVNFSNFAGAVTAVSLEFSGLPTIAVTGTGDASTTNDVGSSLGDIDLLQIELYAIAGATAPAIDGLPYQFGIVSFADDTETLFSADPPPLVSPDDPLLDPWFFWFHWENDMLETFEVRGTFAVARHQAPIPTPSALLLGSLGAGLVGWMRRRRTL